MERINHNPYSDECPDYGSIAFTPVRAALRAQNNIEEAAATLVLVNAWRQHNDVLKEAWDRQVQEDERLQAENDRAAQDEDERQRLRREQEEEVERQELEKKKPKMKSFDNGSMVEDFISPRPSSYALNKLESFDYVELWYFTPEGCQEALDSQRSQTDDAFSLTKVGDSLALKQLAAVKASRSAVKDSDLTWAQMMMGKVLFLQHVQDTNWPESHLKSLARFFVNLEIHPYRLRPHGERVLVLYQAKVRRNWHDRLKRDQGFNIAIINESLVQSISSEVLDRAKLDSIREVSLFGFHILRSLANIISFQTKSLSNNTKFSLRFSLPDGIFVIFMLRFSSRFPCCFTRFCFYFPFGFRSMLPFFNKCFASGFSSIVIHFNDTLHKSLLHLLCKSRYNVYATR
jgi:hypothetical protein